MKIAVTGASGFIGQSVCAALQKKDGVSVVGLTRSLRPEMPGSPDMIWEATDYSLESLCKVLEGIDAVIHLAAIRGTSGLISDYHPNETMLESLLLAMGKTGVKKIVFASSIAVYSDIEQIPWTEEMPLSPKTLYGVSKAACEHLCRYYTKKFGFTYIIFRIAQVLGTGEKRKGMMNVFIDSALLGRQLKVIGKSAAKRQYIYVEDLAQAIAAALEEISSSQILNIGMEEACTNLEIARTVNSVFDNPKEIDYVSDVPETIEPSCMKICRLKNELGITPLSMEEALTDIKKQLKIHVSC